MKSINPDIVVEGEIGYIGTSSRVLDEILEGAGELTTPEQAKEFVAGSGIEVLAPAVGHVHGMLRSMVEGSARKHLDIERIRAIRQVAGIPMTLNGIGNRRRGFLAACVRSPIPTGSQAKAPAPPP